MKSNPRSIKKMIKHTTKLFAILWTAGMIGVLSFLLVDLSALFANLPSTGETEMPFPPMVVKILAVIQPSILVSLAVFAGTRLAPAIGLSAPAAEALAKGGSPGRALKPQIIPGLISGVATGIAIIVIWVLVKSSLPEMFVTRAEKLSVIMPLLTRILYGGITEELLLRWGLMTFLVWVPWRLFQRGQGRPRPIIFWTAILTSAVLFGIGHLPMVSFLGVEFSVAIVMYVVIVNSLFGLIAGFLYWLRGLEAAIIAHMSVHLVLVSATSFVT
jgi:Type II CAAX prenyl endopeptidase Rce1-like